MMDYLGRSSHAGQGQLQLKKAEEFQRWLRKGHIRSGFLADRNPLIVATRGKSGKGRVLVMSLYCSIRFVS